MPCRTVRRVKTWADYYYEEGSGAEFEMVTGEYLVPEAVDLARCGVRQFLGSGRAAVVIPMREVEPTVAEILSVLRRQMPAESIIVVDDGSSATACEAVRRAGARLVTKESVFELLDLERLLPAIRVPVIPTGKGSAVLAGYLYLYLRQQCTGRAIDWVIQHDADVVGYAEAPGIDYLGYGILQGAAARHIKLAQSDRDNEPSMNARSLLCALYMLLRVCPGEVMQQIAARAEQLFCRLAPLKWMLSGQFALEAACAFGRPFGSGYVEETLVSAYAADLAAACGGQTVQVALARPYVDGVDDGVKVAAIMQLVSNFLMALALFRKPVHIWRLSDIARFNSLHAGRRPVALIPSGTEPVLVRVLPSEYVLPSVAMLDRTGYLRRERVSSFFAQSK